MLSEIMRLSEKNKEFTELIKSATSSESVQLQNMTESFEKMLNLLNETEKGNHQIVSLVESLNADKNEILNSVDSLSAVVEESTASTEETSALIIQLESNMDGVVGHAERLQEIAEELQQNVSIFTI